MLDHFGKSKVVGSQQFNELINPSEFQREWPVFKRSVFDNYRGLSFKELVKEIFTKRKTSFPAISRLLEFIVVLPMSSVTCERGFSKHNRKNKIWFQKSTGINDKRQVTALFGGSMINDFLTLQRIYKGKTAQCHPCRTRASLIHAICQR